ncbi:TonB family protein [Ekhidna sp.]
MKKSIALLIGLVLSLSMHAQTDTLVLENEDPVFTKVDEPATFPGGTEAMYQFLAKHLKYPKEAQRMGLQGRVFVQFIIEKDGSITNAKVVRGVGAGCDEEALRVINLMPKWIPAKQNGGVVRQIQVKNIVFQLANSKPVGYAGTAFKNDTLGYYAAPEHFERPNTIGVLQFDTSNYSFNIEIDTTLYFAKPEKSFNQFFMSYWEAILSDQSYHYTDTEISIGFDVLESGEITNFWLGKDSNPNDTAIVRALMNMQAWKPAYRLGKATKQKMILEVISYVGTVYDSVDIPASEPENYWEFIKNNLRYPRSARLKGVECLVDIEFIVEKTGKITNIKLVRDNGYGCGEEVVRLFTTMPKWTPGFHNGEKVGQRVKHRFPVKLN